MRAMMRNEGLGAFVGGKVIGAGMATVARAHVCHIHVPIANCSWVPCHLLSLTGCGSVPDAGIRPVLAGAGPAHALYFSIYEKSRLYFDAKNNQILGNSKTKQQSPQATSPQPMRAVQRARPFALHLHTIPS